LAHQHQLALERTRIYFSFFLQETHALTDAVVSLDGQPVGSGDKISLGSHRFRITHRKTENFAPISSRGMAGMTSGNSI
jgi:hypothetical protein